MFCKKCGAQLNDGAKFCSNCGKPAQATEFSSKSYEDHILTFGIIFVAFAIVFVIIGEIVVFSDDKVDDSNNQSVIVRDDYVISDGNSKSNLANGGWVTEQNNCIYYYVEGKILKENLNNGEKLVLFEQQNSNLEINKLFVINEWIYFAEEPSGFGLRLSRIKIDGSCYETFEDQIIFDWTVYANNIYIVTSEHISASQSRYFLAILDWENSSYNKIMNLSFLGDSYFCFNSTEYYGNNITVIDIYSDFEFSLLGIEDGYAYFLSHFEQETIQFWRISMHDFASRVKVVYDYRFPFNAYIHEGDIYAIGKSYNNGKVNINYNIIDFDSEQIKENLVDIERNDDWFYYNDDDDIYLNFIDSDIVISTLDGIFLVDNRNNVTQISADWGCYLCVINDKIYYWDSMFCRINADGSNWEEIKLDNFLAASN